MRSNEVSGQSPVLRSMLADVVTTMRQPVSEETIRRGRLAAGVLAVAGSAAVLLGLGSAAEAKALPKTQNQVIRSGDSLGSIAKRHGVSVADLAAANNISPKSIIYSGQSLQIPTSGTVRSQPPASSVSTYVVKRGDTLSSIAASRGISVATLGAANNLSTKSVLSIGKSLSVPGVADSSPAASTAPKSALSQSKSGVVPSDLSPNDPRFALRTEFQRAANTYHVPVGLLEAMTWNESGWQNHVRSGVGAVGIGQLMPGTVKHVNEMAGTKLDPNKPSDNIKMSAMYLRYLLDESHGDYKMALAAYYQGLGSVRSIGLYDDTKQYIRTITALQKNYFS